ncbi:MAG: FKBP-type peptidyl-prolyl cis-trans isomerase [Planctomycetes bacterium]|nr:FKBP-type peptidyl-prolyl cis-trans isomerase [Planctomycetota bacterium]
MKVAMVVAFFLAVVTTFWTWYPRATVQSDEETLQGQLLTYKHQEVKPEEIAFLQVATWNEESESPQVFIVHQKDGKWLIQSHHDYPADGKDRIGRTAGDVLNVRAGPRVTGGSSEHEKLGVVDPTDKNADAKKGRGKRVTLKSAGGTALVDLIVGDKAESGDVYYVRLPGDNSVYTAEVKPDISTKFQDWVEPDPLKVRRGDVRKMVIRDYSIDETKGTVEQRSETELAKGKDDKKWSSPATPEGKAVDEDVTDSMLSDIAGMRLAGVRPFDPRWLQPRGFFIDAKQGRIYGNEGSLEVYTKDGLFYMLYFGEIALGDEADQSADAADTDGAKKSEDKAAQNKDGEKEKGHNRYMAVFAGYSPELDENLAEADAKLKADLEALKAPKEDKKGEKKGEGENPEEKKDEKKDEKPKTEEELKAEHAKAAEKIKNEGHQRAKKAMQRFQKFFYVISDDSFKRLRPPLSRLFKLKKPDTATLPGDKVNDPQDLIEKASGLFYADLEQGEGDEVKEGDKVEVHYTGWLASDGTKFDSSLDRGQPFPVEVGKGGVIKGWDEGLQGMKLGGKRKLIIPAELGYGAAGSPPKIPANAQLVFDVEVLKLNDKAAPPKSAKPKEAVQPEVQLQPDGE